MKRKFLAVLLAVAMIATQMASIAVMASTEEVTKTYVDMDFENWTTDNLGDVKNSDGSTIYHDVSGDSSVITRATVSDRAGQVMKVALKTSGGGNHLIRTRMSRGYGIFPDNYSNVKVLWNEFSIKDEGGFVGFGTTENDGARNIVSINKSGEIALGALRGSCEYKPGGAAEQEHQPGIIIPDVQLELGKWYDIKVAADFTDANANSGVPAYVWVNGKLVANGTKISSITPGFPWAFQDFYFDQAEKEGITAYVDDVKTYETALLGEIELPEDMVIKSYVDMSFDNWTTDYLGSVLNRDGSTIYHDVSGDSSVITRATVSDRAGQVMKATLKTSGGATEGSGHLIRTRMNRGYGIFPDNYNNVKVLWNEFSIKYEGGFVGFGTTENDGARNFVTVNKNGQIELGALRGHCEYKPNGAKENDFVPGTIIPDVQLELGQWYDIKVAADFTDEGANSGVPAYVWVNGKLVAKGTKITSITPGFPWAFQDFYFDQATKEGIIAYVDDVKTYETSGLGEIETPVEPEIEIKKHFDIDFENWNGSLGSIANSDGTAINHDAAGDTSVVSSATDSERGNVMKVDVKTSGGGNYLVRSRMNRGVIPTDHSNVNVLWNEFSIKYEGGFAGFGTNENDGGYSIVSINKDGQIALGAKLAYCEYAPAGTEESGFKTGTILPDVQLKLGEWYDIKVAADFTVEDADTGVLAYVWVNGKLVAEGVKIEKIYPTRAWTYQKLFFDQAANAGTTAYVDDIKVYETDELGEIVRPDPVTKRHFDINFENWSSGLGSIANSDGTAINHDTAGDTSVVSAATVSDRDGKVMKVNVKTSGGNNYLFRTRMYSSTVTEKYENVEVLWNEFSIKYEGGFAGFSTNHDDNAYEIVNINKNGQITLGTRWGFGEVGGGNFAAGTTLTGVQLELGKWYDIKVAADFTDNGETGAVAYVWVNGELVADGVKL
ncbi:MAG: hypothetical protein IKV88_07350, partial [Clostridia bacterium]|nr:hypothetical protein [Clostridia bacterium]